MKMTKRELINLYNEGKLKVTAQCGVTGFQVVEVIHGFNDQVFGFFQYAEGKKFTLRTIRYEERAFIRINNEKIYMDNCLRRF
jgi:hypothetical protein